MRTPVAPMTNMSLSLQDAEAPEQHVTGKRRGLDFAAGAGLVVALAAAVVGVTGCSGPGLAVPSWHAGDVNTGHAHSVALEAGDGPATSIDTAVQSATGDVNGDGFFTLVDQARAADLVLRLDVTQQFI